MLAKVDYLIKWSRYRLALLLRCLYSLQFSRSSNVIDKENLEGEFAKQFGGSFRRMFEYTEYNFDWSNELRDSNTPV